MIFLYIHFVCVERKARKKSFWDAGFYSYYHMRKEEEKLSKFLLLHPFSTVFENQVKSLIWTVLPDMSTLIGQNLIENAKE